MELLKPNYISTTTGFTVESNTTSAEYLFDPDTSFQYVSSGFANDNTATSIVVSFSETMTVSRIALLEHNLEDFYVFYNGATANLFALTSTCSTVASSFVSNTASDIYLTCQPVACTSVTFVLRKTIVANQEKAIGYLVVSDVALALPRPPSASDYTPVLNPMNVVHRLSDGGTRIQNVANKWSAQLKYKYLEESVRDDLEELYESHSDLIFVAFGTTTGWDGVLFPCVWDGPFDFHKYSDNAQGAGFSGSINLKETPR
jgi:hypothetical protein